MLGLSIIVPGISALVGYKYGGIFGAMAASLFGGSAVNAYRAIHFYKFGTEDADREARISATYALLAGALGGVVWYKAAQRPPEYLANEDEPEPEPAIVPTPPRRRRPVANRSACDIRPVLPPASED
jgi:hypothetical protein